MRGDRGGSGTWRWGARACKLELAYTFKPLLCNVSFYMPICVGEVRGIIGV